MKELLPSKFEPDYEAATGALFPGSSPQYSERDMYEFCVRVLNKVMLKINEEQDASEHQFRCKDGVHIYYKILDMLNEPWDFDNE